MAISTTPHVLRSRSFDQALPPALRPVVRAYLLGYASSTAPRLLTLLMTHLGRRRKNIDEKPEDYFFLSLIRILRGGLEWQRFPTFCAALVGGSTLLEIPLRKAFAQLAKGLNKAAQLRLARWLSTFTAAWFSLKLLQSKESPAFISNIPIQTLTGIQHQPTRFAGRTMDLTLFAVTRALDVIVGELWSQRKARRKACGKPWSELEKLLTTLADPAIFSVSCALIMWAWIYNPSSLPRSYNKWIASAAAVDTRLVTALRRTRWGQIQYGVDTGEAPLLQSMCHDYGWPLSYGDPVQSIPFPCELVHMGTGPNCEYHALSRLLRSFVWAFSTYLPLNLVLTLRKPSVKALIRALKSSTRSSLFLAAFISTFYYGICLGRTRLGPKFFGTTIPKLQTIDSGFCIGCGCAVCGWSVLLENEGRRKELGLFVAPRALATLCPRRYEWKYQWRETMAFACATAVVFTCVSERPERVRGVLGRVMEKVLRE